jgi:ornithine decarboxylase
MHADLETVVINPTYDAVDLFKSVPSPDINVYNRSVSEVAQARLESITNQKWESDQENAFFVGDLGEVFRQHLRWKSLLPRIEPFFGMFHYVWLIVNSLFAI